MAAVANGDLDVRVPVRSTDELGELNQHFNAMVDELRAAARARELFGRYVSPVVARAALERGVGRGGELVHATAMFVDLRGFTQRTQELGAPAVMEMLNRYYAAVEHSATASSSCSAGRCARSRTTRGARCGRRSTSSARSPRATIRSRQASGYARAR
jgi:hypothetical protein